MMKKIVDLIADCNARALRAGVAQAKKQEQAPFPAPTIHADDIHDTVRKGDIVSMEHPFFALRAGAKKVGNS